MVAVAGVLVSGCGKEKAKAVAPPPAKVTVSSPVQKEITRYMEYTGTLSADASVEIRARVRGFLQKALFQPGTWVEEGAPLYLIDPREYDAQVNKSKSTLVGKEAELALAKVELERTQQLASTGAQTQSDLDKAKAQANRSAADVLIAKSQLDSDNLQLSFTSITAPIAGVVGKDLSDIGMLLNGDGSTLLTKIVDDRTVKAEFFMSEQDILELSKNRKRRDRKEMPTDLPPVLMGTSVDREYPYQGTIDFLDNQLDSNTGTYRLRAKFDNKDKKLIVGTFVRLKIPVERKVALLVPEVAVGQDQAGNYVLVVGKDNVVERKAVTVGRTTDRMKPVEIGLEGSEQIVVNGILQARPGAKVDPTVVSIEDFMKPVLPKGAAEDGASTSSKSGK